MRLNKILSTAGIASRRAADELISQGRVEVNGLPAKPARELHVGDRIDLRQEALQRSLTVLDLSVRRGPAAAAQALYAETADSLARARARADLRRQGVEPALAQGRPTRRDRRTLAEWQRWSVSIDDDD